MMIITMQHMRSVGFCADGVEVFFQRNNLDYTSFLNNGIDEALLLNTGSIAAKRVILRAHEDVEHGR